MPKLPRFHPLIAVQCLRVSYRRAIAVREVEARAALAAAQQETAVDALISAGQALQRQPRLAGTTT